MKLGTHVGSGQMYHVYWNQAAAAYLSLYFFIFLSPIFNIEIFRHTFLENLFSLEDWNLVHTWTVGRCIMCTGIRLLLLIRPFISSFFCLTNFQHWNFSSHFLGTVRPRRLKVGTHLDSGQVYHVYQNQAAAAYSSLYFFIFLSLQFSYWNFLSHFSQELWGLEDWNLVHTWTVGRYIVYTGIRLLLLIRPFISSFFFLSNYQTLKVFVTFFSGTVRSGRLKLGTHVDSGQMYRVHQKQAAAAYLCLYFFIFLSLQFSNIKIFRHTLLTNCEA